MTASERPYVTLFKQLLTYMKESLDEVRPNTIVTYCSRLMCLAAKNTKALTQTLYCG